MPLARSIVREDIFTAEVVASTAVILSEGIYIGNTSTQSIWAQATSVSGTPDILIEYLCSPNDVSANFVLPALSTSLSINDEDPHITFISVPVTRYIKVRVTGVNLNPADTVVTIYIQHT